MNPSSLNRVDGPAATFTPAKKRTRFPLFPLSKPTGLRGSHPVVLAEHTKYASWPGGFTLQEWQLFAHAPGAQLTAVADEARKRVDDPKWIPFPRLSTLDERKIP